MTGGSEKAFLALRKAKNMLLIFKIIENFINKCAS
jgi:hypothetical protein